MLRGLALPGIALMNIEWFTRPPMELGDGLPTGATGLEHATGWLVFVLVQGKFWLLFALLFGAGFTVLRQRLLAEGRPFAAPCLRRAAMLFVLGIAHALLLWCGDILHSYAVAAVMLLVLTPVTDADPRLGPPLRGALGGMLLLLFTGWLALGMLTVLASDAFAPGAIPLEMLRSVDDAATAQAAQVYAHGSWMDVTAQRARDFMHGVSSDLFVIPVALGVFLVGSWLLDSGRLSRPADFPRFHRVAAFGLLPLGLAITVAGTWRATGVRDAPDAAAAMIAQFAHWAGALPMTLGYISLVVLAMRRAAPAAFLQRWFAPAGRLALTNYLMASLVFSTLFYGYGFGLWGQVSRPAQVGMVVALTVVQCALSAWWIARFHFGPLEWVWRAATWLRWPPLRRAAMRPAEAVR